MNRQFLSIAGVVAVVAAGCGDGGSGPEGDLIPAELAAEWYTGATCYPQCGLTLVPVANPADSMNFTRTSTTTLRLTRSGGYSMRIVGTADTTVSGRARAEAGYLVLSDPTGADTADYVLEGEYLSLHWRRRVAVSDGGTTFDARLKGRFRKR
ncbi:MAG TPA: hypothetical protein VK936_04870 [Longimicrobiales bacterium]|nr:hypothetical protein [Longimicrobiales bacterium]